MSPDHGRPTMLPNVFFERFSDYADYFGFTAVDGDERCYRTENFKTLVPLDSEALLVKPAGGHQTLGNLSALPIEMIQEILGHVDLYTVMRFRTLNSRARLIVNSQPKYRDIYNYAPNLLRGMLLTNAAFYHTLSDVYQALTDGRCGVCSVPNPDNHDSLSETTRYSTMFDMPFCLRCCAECMEKVKKRIFLVCLREVKQLYALEEYDLSGLVPIVQRPGMVDAYGLEPKATTFGGDRLASGTPMYRHPDLEAVALRKYGTKESWERARLARRDTAVKSEETAKREWLFALSMMGMNRRLDFSIMVPMLLRTPRRQLNWGRRCKGCWVAQRFYGFGGSEITDLKSATVDFLSDAGFVAHMRTCKALEELWRILEDWEAGDSRGIYRKILLSRDPRAMLNNKTYHGYLPKRPLIEVWNSQKGK